MPWYKAGTVSIVQNSNAVTGDGTAFIANSRVGDAFLGPDGYWYEVTNIASDTAMAISPTYKGATVSGSAYAIMPVQGYPKLLADAFNQLRLQFGDKMAALGTTGNFDVLPVDKGGTGGTSAATALTELGLKDYTQNINVTGLGVRGTTYAIANQQGVYVGWNEEENGEADFACNNGGGPGGFTWRVVNLDNTVEATRMSLTGAGVLTVPTLNLGNALAVKYGGTGGSTQAAARTGLGLGSAAVENVVPQTKGGTGRSDGRARFSELAANQAAALYNTQGTYIGWNSTGTGETHFICNMGGGYGGFTFRTVNADNTLTGPTMTYSNNGVLTVPSGVVPLSDGGANLGTSAVRWATVYAVTSAINTSDAREKTSVSPFSDAEVSAAMLLAKEVGSYKWLASVAKKGDGAARTHIGLTVQRAIEIMAEQGLNPLDYAFICYDEWEGESEISTEEVYGNIYSVGERIFADVLQAEFAPYVGSPSFRWEETSRRTIITKPEVLPGNRYGFRYDQLALFIARGLEERIARLETLMTSAA
jgi:hypothetical protein